MKIEIELGYIEDLRSQLQQKEQEVYHLEEKLKGLSESELNKKAVRLSYKLFNDYMNAVFVNLGFDEWKWDEVIVRDNMEHWLGKNWWESDRIKVELGATVTTEFRRALLKIGILPKKEVNE